MKKVLFITATPKQKKESITLKMADQFISAYKDCNPEDEITTLNLYDENIQFLNMDDIMDYYAPEHLRPEVKQSKIDIMGYLNQFMAADKYIIAAPMWNLGTPAILKAYFEYVNISGYTFKYTKQGAVGLMNDKARKIAFISSRGGCYSKGVMKQFEYGELGVRAQFKFFGIDDFVSVLMEEADAIFGEELENALQSAMNNAKEQGRMF